MDNKRKKKYLANDSKSVVNEPAAVYTQPMSDTETVVERYLKPDTDFYRAITFEEFATGARKHIQKLFKDKE